MRVVNFKADVVDLWIKHDLTLVEYVWSLQSLAHDTVARMVADERKKMWKKTQKKNRKKVKA